MAQDLTQQVIQDQIAKTMSELASSSHPIQSSRVWKHPEGYRYLVQWSNAVLLRYLIRLFTNPLPKSEYRRKAQLDDAGRSVVRNIEEGYKRQTTTEYSQFISFSQGSLEECKGDIRELTEDKFLDSRPGSSLESLGISLGSFNTALSPLKEDRGSLKEASLGYRPLDVLYPPLGKVRAEDLSYEIFLELINKTDFLFRTLVQSLEKKLKEDQKGYQINQARIKEAFKKR